MAHYVYITEYAYDFNKFLIYNTKPICVSVICKLRPFHFVTPVG